MSQITYEQFESVDIRAGTIVKVEEFLRIKKPAFKVWADFGDKIGILQTSAQITVHYKSEDLIGRQIAGFKSEFLLLGFPDDNFAISLIKVDPQVPNGNKIC